MQDFAGNGAGPLERPADEVADRLVRRALRHAAGDQVLKRIAGDIMATVRATDHVFRFGGEEFVVIMPDTDMAVATIVAERLRRRIASEPFSIDRGAKALDVTISIGLATLDPGADNAASILKRADQALYRAKEKGKKTIMQAKT